MRNGRAKRGGMAFALAFLMLAVALVPAMQSDSDASGSYWSYTITPEGHILGDYTAIGGDGPSTGSYVSSNGKNVGSWGFGEDGYGPFGSFYAAFDPNNDNAFVGIVDPNNLHAMRDGSLTDGYNIMWVVPTIYVSMDSSGNLTMTNNPNGGNALAHTVDGHTYDYLAYGVYEASTKTVGGKTVLASASGADPSVCVTRSEFRGYANANTVENGKAMLWNFFQWNLYREMAVAVMNSWDSQTVAGNGFVELPEVSVTSDSSPYSKTTGLLDSSGPYAGTRGTGNGNMQDSVKVFIENAWGSMTDVVDGILVDSNLTIYLDQSSTPTDTKNTIKIHSSWEGLLPDKTGFASDPDAIFEDTWGLPTGNAGSQSSGLYDYVYVHSKRLDNRLLTVGGSPLYGTYQCGINLTEFTNGDTVAGNDVGTRLAFVYDAPEATLDHSSLSDKGIDVSDLPASVTIEDSDTAYGDLGTVNGYKHVGWIIDGQKYSVNQKVVKTTSHTAQSVWVRELTFQSDPGTDGIIAFAKS